MQVEWWYWIIAGFCLIGVELIIPSFTIIWFGIGALFVGTFCGLWSGFPVAGQVGLWLTASICFTVMWFRYLKPKGDRMQDMLRKKGIVGETGIIIRGTEDNSGRGIVKFRNMVLGADEWGCCSREILQVGDLVRVVDIQGQILKVEII